MGLGQKITMSLTYSRVAFSSRPVTVYCRFLSTSARRLEQSAPLEAPSESNTRSTVGPSHTASSSTLAETRAAIEAWAEATMRPEATLKVLERPSLTRMKELWVTLPTGEARKTDTNMHKYQVPYGHHLISFRRHCREKWLRPDGSDPYMSPPAVSSWRRMWVGGEMRWPFNPKHGVSIAHTAMSVQTKLSDVTLKNFEEGGRPMLLVTQDITWRKTHEKSNTRAGWALYDRIVHAYVPPSNEKKVRQVQVPERVDFTYEFLPTPTMLFRFSALTFNAHRIHLEKEYAEAEGYPERLVHGPLTALMLLDVTWLQKPTACFRHFTYRAHNPLIVNQPIVIKGSLTGPNEVTVWAESGVDGTVGMTGKIEMWPDVVKRLTKGEKPVDLRMMSDSLRLKLESAIRSSAKMGGASKDDEVENRINIP